MKEVPFERIVLIGFMGAGKTSVGKVLASRLGWRFIDFDDEIEIEAGKSVAEIFTLHGEDHFRALEARVADRLMGERRVVLGSGGGWAARAGRLDKLPDSTETVWLRVSPERALARVSEEPGRRPLLAGPNAAEGATQLVEKRSPHYARARWTVDTEHLSVEDVSARILEMLGANHSNEQ